VCWPLTGVSILMFFDIVEEARSVLTEDGSTTLTLVANNSTHGGSSSRCEKERVVCEAAG
jgi:hypothetical protein